jgi:iron(III) transport system substrate-binding protein
MFSRIACLLALFAIGCTKSGDRVVVYSAQDADYAGRIFGDIEPSLGVKVEPKYDTEANKSVSLVAELLEEAGRPRCDVHWNNEPLGSVKLARAGVYEPYTSPEAASYPDRCRANPAFTQFAERARVLIVNTDRVAQAEWPTSVFDLTKPRFKGQVAIAKPQFGTTATHAACLFVLALKANGVQLAAGNKAVAVGVARGEFAVGLTDSDDATLEQLAGKPVALILPDATTDRPRFGTLYLPNTVALIKNGPNPVAGRKLIDRLLSAEVERKLSEGGGYQLPLRTDLHDLRPTVLKTTPPGTRMDADFNRAIDLWDETQAFLRDTFAR